MYSFAKKSICVVLLYSLFTVHISYPKTVEIHKHTYKVFFGNVRYNLYTIYNIYNICTLYMHALISVANVRGLLNNCHKSPQVKAFCRFALTPPPLHSQKLMRILYSRRHQEEILVEKWNFLFNARIQGRARNVQAGCIVPTYYYSSSEAAPLTWNDCMCD